MEIELALAEAYAARQGLEAVFVYVESREDLIPDLLAGNGDLIAANLTVTPARKNLVAFTVPLEVARTLPERAQYLLGFRSFTPEFGGRLGLVDYDDAARLLEQ